MYLLCLVHQEAAGTPANLGGMIRLQWYYAQDEKAVGPVEEDEFRSLAADGAISASTLVWHSGMAGWLPCEVALAEDNAAGAGATTCTVCEGVFEPDEVIELRGTVVCGQCKPVFVQLLREGARVDTAFEYGGFWIRAGALLLDYVFLYVCNLMVLTLSGMTAAIGAEWVGAVAVIAAWFVQFLVPLVYGTFFVGRYGATPGKMICRLRIVRPDGEPVSYPRAFGRYWGTVLSGMTLGIGYIICAFDDERRTLHDMICDTRVVRV